MTDTPIPDDAIDAYRTAAVDNAGNCGSITGCDDAVRAGLAAAAPHLAEAHLRRKLRDLEGPPREETADEQRRRAEVRSYERMHRDDERAKIADALAAAGFEQAAAHVRTLPVDAA